jgi:hypothetical protein
MVAESAWDYRLSNPRSLPACWKKWPGRYLPRHRSTSCSLFLRPEIASPSGKRNRAKAIHIVERGNQGPKSKKEGKGTVTQHSTGADLNLVCVHELLNTCRAYQPDCSAGLAIIESRDREDWFLAGSWLRSARIRCRTFRSVATMRLTTQPKLIK